MKNELAISSLGLEIVTGPFGTDEQEILQRAMTEWINRNALPNAGFDIAICAWQPKGEGITPPQVVAATCAIAENSSEEDLHEFQTKASALKTVLMAYAISAQQESDIYCLRVNDGYKTQPLVLVLNAADGRFFVNLTTWFNYVSYGKMMRFLEFFGNLLCGMHRFDPVLVESFGRAFGMTEVMLTDQSLAFTPITPDSW